MNRRSFLSTLATALISVALARELGSVVASAPEPPLKVINAADFGLGNGVDDTKALQAAFDCSARYGGLPVHMPPGVYYLTDSIIVRNSINIHDGRGVVFNGSKLQAGKACFYVPIG